MERSGELGVQPTTARARLRADGRAATSSLRRDTLLNLGGSIAPVLIALATVPLYLDAIGQARYGVLTIAWLLVGYFGVFNLGLGRAAGNQVARLRDAPAEERENVFWTALAMNSVLGAAGAGALFAVAYLLVNHVLSLSLDLRSEVVQGLPFLALAVPFATVSMVCLGTLEGLQRFGIANAITVTATAVYQLVPLVIALAFGPNLRWLLASAAVAPVVGAAFGLLACRRALPLRRRPKVERRHVSTLLSYGGWVSLTDLLAPLLTVVDRFVIGTVSGPRAVAQYTVPMGFVSAISLAPFSLARSLFPRFSSLPELEARLVARDATRILAAVATPVVVIAMLVVDPFLRVWVGASFARAAAPVAEIVLLGSWINSLSLVPYTYLQGRRRPDVPAKFHLAELPPYVLVLWVGLSLGGIEGAAWAWTARVVVDAALLAYASRLYSRHDARLSSPTTLALLMAAITYVVAVLISDHPLLRIALGAPLAMLATIAGWRSVPAQFRAQLVALRLARGAIE